MRLGAAIWTILVIGLSSATAHAADRRDADVAALQVALSAANVYKGPIDGQRGRQTIDALVAFQQREGLAPDGIVGPLTKRALGPLGRPDLGTRSLARGAMGWDVAELQFRLAWHGFPSGRFDGRFGSHLEAAVRCFQRFAGLPVLGITGPQTRAALRRAIPTNPLRLRAPVNAPIGDRFGPRGNAFHTGVDFIAAAGTIVGAARSGQVTWAGPRGSFGNVVIVAHGKGVRTLYAHLSRIDVSLLDRVSTGQQIGLVGSTGRSTGPHLHFEVRVRGAAVDPLDNLG